MREGPNLWAEQISGQVGGADGWRWVEEMGGDGWRRWVEEMGGTDGWRRWVEEMGGGDGQSRWVEEMGEETDDQKGEADGQVDRWINTHTSTLTSKCPPHTAVFSTSSQYLSNVSEVMENATRHTQWK